MIGSLAPMPKAVRAFLLIVPRPVSPSLRPIFLVKLDNFPVNPPVRAHHRTLLI